MTKTLNDDKAAVEITLDVEEIEEVIAPGLNTFNHNEIFVNDEVELCVEKIEEVIAPRIATNHNETLEVDLSVEEIEEVIAPKITVNHNETLVAE